MILKNFFVDFIKWFKKILIYKKNWIWGQFLDAVAFSGLPPWRLLMHIFIKHFCSKLTLIKHVHKAIKQRHQWISFTQLENIQGVKIIIVIWFAIPPGSWNKY